MLRIFPPLLLLCQLTYAQKPLPATDSFPIVATVNVTVTDLKSKPRKGEEVLFRGEKTGKIFSGFSDVSGKLKQLLPPGDTYKVSVKSFSDTNSYAIITIPELAADEYFSDPFWVNINFEPARSYRLNHVHFDTDKASLRPDSYKELTELTGYLQRHEDIKIEIAGHTDNEGSDTHNLKLSQDRANMIRNYLISKGIKAARLTAKGYGAAQPVADNATAEGRQQNRRTEVRIL